ncbi:MAG TPA: serine acetyltransferase [Candidatus Binatia bacterium]|nr:serine acetyltransferase [Candidatus Binatia bacterium]
MFENLRADFAAATGHRTMEKGLLRVLMRVETPAIVCYRYSHWVLKLNIPVVKQLLMIPALFWQRFNQMFFGIFISPDAEIGPGMVIHTPYGVFIPPVKIGSNCTFTTGTLINSGCKSVGDNVYFGAGCKIIGDVKIGNNVVIVANSVVLTDVPDNITIMGVPARIKLPGGRGPKKFAWRAMDRKDAKPEAANGQGTNGNKPATAAGTNGNAGTSAAVNEKTVQ